MASNYHGLIHASPHKPSTYISIMFYTFLIVYQSLHMTDHLLQYYERYVLKMSSPYDKEEIMINRAISYCLMILVIITSISVISTLSIRQKVMAHILPPSEGGKVLGEDKANVHSSTPNQLMLVLSVTVIITVMVARVQEKSQVKCRSTVMQ